MQVSKLSKFPIFANLNEKQKVVLSSILSEKSYVAEQVIFNQGDNAFNGYFVISGSIVIQLSDEKFADGVKVITELSAGELFGEIALVDGGKRSATCKAGSEGAEVAVINRQDFMQILYAGNEFACNLMDIISINLVKDLRNMSQKLMRQV